MSQLRNSFLVTLCLALWAQPRAAAQAGSGQMTLAVSHSMASPAPVATPVTFTASAAGVSANNWYQFSVRKGSGAYHIIRDYSPLNTLTWTASESEGSYEMQVAAANLDTGETSVASKRFHFTAIATGGQPVVSPTANSLVFLYSAPPCPTGQKIRVEFASPGGLRQSTPYRDCHPSYTSNFYLAGLQANTTYNAQHAIDTGSGITRSTMQTFTTGDLPANLYTDTILIPSPAGASNPILLGSVLGGSAVANDLAGNVLWYGPNFSSWTLTSPESGGNMWGIVEANPVNPTGELIRKIDISGMTLLETNAARVNQQLAYLGKRQITAFHHEARTLPDGHIAVLADVEQVLSDVQGPGPIDIIGDMIIVFDQNLNVVWTWDTFDNLDVTRKAVMGETCATEGGCPPFALASNANDWTHGNAVTATPDGNLLYSSRNQDWLIKIAYGQGSGDGHIIWRLGKDGDFTISSNDPYPWFSHQHDAAFETADPTKLLVFDDGNTRVAAMGGNSRGQVLVIDEPNRTATLLLNADLGVYAAAVGSAQLLLDGNYHFDAGFVVENNTTDAYSFEVAPNAQILYNAHQNTVLYRSFRMVDLYHLN